MHALTLPLPSGDTWTRADYEALPEDLPVRVSLVHQTAPAFAVFTYELDDATGGYVATGVHHDRITATLPFALDIELKPVRER